MLRKLYFSFPVQLIIEHLKVNQMPLLCWILLLLVINRAFGNVFGIPYLFLDPEYLNHVGFSSFFIVGITYGLMTIAFHITSYILFSSKYSFIGILSYPFSKFSINNSVIPLAVMINYLIAVFTFQINNEYVTPYSTFKMVVALPLGAILAIVVFYQYFRSTNKDIFIYLAGSVDRRLKKSKVNRGTALGRLSQVKKKSYHVESYLDLKLRLRSTKGLHDFYDKESILKVFDQNHLNSFIIEVLIIAFIIISGFFVDVRYFQIPAAATAILVITLAIMLLGAVSYWFRGWVVSTMLGLFLCFSLIVQSGILKEKFEAMGLDYEKEKIPYTIDQIQQVMSVSAIEEDKQRTLEILKRWKSKQESTKPKAIFLCVSGGGLRSALWTTNVLQHVDQSLNGRLLDKTVLITGASGGMIGASYYREMFLQNKHLQLRSEAFLKKMARDNLNPILLSFFVNDMFIRFHHYEYAGKSYLKDRGIAFERQLNLNTEQVMNKPLSAYKKHEEAAEIPLLILGPTVANDGRKLYLSAQKVSYMSMQTIPAPAENLIIDGVDFMRFFEDQGAADLNFISALRMNASFPYITPNVTLPTSPGMVIMDAGVSDNFGISDALRFIHSFKDWLEENTSGIVILGIRDTKKVTHIKPLDNLSIVDRFSAPISSVYNNLANLQDISNDNKIRMLKSDFRQPVDYISIEYDKNAMIEEDGKTLQSSSASLSWHLTSKEKESIIFNVRTKKNEQHMDELLDLLSSSATNISVEPN